jgi:hypothetical protein
LTPHSYHHPSIFYNFITSELNRYRLYCSEDSDFEATKSAFHERLLARGYTHCYLSLLFNNTPDRASLLEKLARSYSRVISKNTSHTQHPPLIFITARTPKTEFLNLRQCLEIPEYVYSTIEGTEIFNRIIICNKTTSNLAQLALTSAISTSTEE